jgi:hypothetical protein
MHKSIDRAVEISEQLYPDSGPVTARMEYDHRVSMLTLTGTVVAV